MDRFGGDARKANIIMEDKFKGLSYGEVIDLLPNCKNFDDEVEIYKKLVELGEKEIVRVTAVDEQDAEDLALTLVMKGGVGLKGRICTYNVVIDEE